MFEAMPVLRADGRESFVLCNVVAGKHSVSNLLSLATQTCEREASFLFAWVVKWKKLKDRNTRVGQEEFICSAGSLSAEQKQQ